MSSREDLLPVPRQGPSAVNVLAGVAFSAGSASVTAVSTIARSARPVMRPAVALPRMALRSGPGRRVGAALDRVLVTLDDSGRLSRRRADVAARKALDATVDRAVTSIIRAGLVESITAEVIAAQVPERVAEQLAESQVVDRLLESSLYEEVIDRVLASEELWLLVDRIAQSPEVMSAITAGSASLANEMAGQVRRRTVVADDVTERIARRLLRRGPRSADAGPTAT